MVQSASCHLIVVVHRSQADKRCNVNYIFIFFDIFCGEVPFMVQPGHVVLRNPKCRDVLARGTDVQFQRGYMHEPKFSNYHQLTLTVSLDNRK